MRTIKRAKQLTKLLSKEALKDKVFATIDGVLQPIVYDSRQVDESLNKQNVFLTPTSRLLKRNTASNTKAVSTVTESQIVDGVETAVQTSPLCVFSYQHGFTEKTNTGLQNWLPSFGSIILSMPEADKRPDIGFNNGGVIGQVPAVFNRDNQDHFQFSSALTLTGDFTVFMYVKLELKPRIENMRFLGNSSDVDVYFSLGDTATKSYILSFSSSSQVIVDSPTKYHQPASNKMLITLQRSGTTMTIRENGTEVAKETTPTTDITFNLFGKRGTSTTTFNGSLYHLSAYNFALSNNLVDLENSIITQASLAKE